MEIHKKCMDRTSSHDSLNIGASILIDLKLNTKNE